MSVPMNTQPFWHSTLSVDSFKACVWDNSLSQPHTTLNSCINSCTIRCMYAKTLTPMRQCMHHVLSTTSMILNTCKPCLHASAWKKVASILKWCICLYIERKEHHGGVDATVTHHVRRFHDAPHTSWCSWQANHQALSHLNDALSIPTDCTHSLMIYHLLSHSSDKDTQHNLPCAGWSYMPSTSVDAHPL